MAITFYCLMVHPSEAQVKELTEKLWPEVQFAKVDRTNSIPEGFQKLVESNYNICFIHHQFNDNLDSFFRDMQKCGRDKTCVFVQLRPKLAPDFDKSKAMELGFSDVISEQINSAERTALKEVLKVEIHRQEVSRRVQDVTEAIQFLIKEVDRVAHEKQRGKEVEFDKLVRNFVAMQSQFDEEVLKEYFDSLAEKMSVAQAFEKKKVKIPEAVLKRKLPHLTEDSYNGMSMRVWLKMLKKFGQSEEN